MNKKDAEKFWREHKAARIKLDRERNRKEDSRRLRLDKEFLKGGIIVSRSKETRHLVVSQKKATARLVGTAKIGKEDGK